MNKFLATVFVLVVAVVGWTRWTHRPEQLVPEPQPAATAQFPIEATQRSAPEAPRLTAKSLSNGFHTRGQWRGNPALGDLNRDGHLDIVVSLRRWDRNAMGDGVFVYLGDGAGNWTEQIAGFDRRLGYGGSALLDLNEDGKLDLAYSGHDQTPRIYINFLDEATNPTWICSTPTGVDTGVICADVALGDFDRDGHADLAIVGQFPQKGGLFVFFGDGSGAIADRPRLEIFGNDHYGSQVEFADLDGDGFVELVAAMDLGVKAYHWDLEKGGPVDQFEGHQELGIQGADLAVEAFDLDGDGVREILVSGYEYSDPARNEVHAPLRIYKRGKDGWVAWGEGLPTGESFFDLDIGQLRTDGPPVIFAGGQWGIQLIEMHEPGKFRSLGRIDDTSKIFNVAAGDVNGDGKDEAIWIGEGGVRALDVELPDSN